MAFYTIENPDHEPVTADIGGRDEWALAQLVQAGADGCTPITNPAPRWAAYVHNLRGMGIQIETLTEKHGGAFPGNHARYILRSQVMKGGAA